MLDDREGVRAGPHAAAEQPPLPEFTVRVSERARHIRLTVTAKDGLVVVVPRGMRVDATAIVTAKAAWARRALASVADKRALHAAGPEALLPDRIELRALGRTVEVRYLPASEAPARAHERAGTLTVTGRGDAEARLGAVSRWLDRAARESLPPRLAHVAAAHGLECRRVRVTSARSRWGSCSARGTISLNRTLLFLPPQLLDALILHELAHTRVMDHSPRFWSLLASLDPQAIAHRAELKCASRYVPAWADA